ncbi:ABC transporter permease [Sanyastnella coralliicola]|uniref:ABC transporter permease n=1 Tax=Sanyastnella coralliicola TaxID=3069118 RepID=UPI0027B99940|nr:ABC transporter permease [Longitalea sp. SCSIO 12813]
MTRSTIAENIKVSLRAIRSQLLRTILTVSIIALGIMALIAMVTATESLKGSITESFSSVGTNTFSIRNKRSRGRRMGRIEKQTPPISYREAREFKRDLDADATISLSAMGSGMATIKYKSEKTNPNVQVLGIDENYLHNSGYELSSGRNFTANDLSTPQNLVILGKDVVGKLFDSWDDPVDKVVSIGSIPYRVVGVLSEKGKIMGMSQDNQCFITLTNLKKQYATANTNYSISVMVDRVEDMDDVIAETYGVMKVVRGDRLGEDQSFEVQQSSGMMDTMTDGVDYVSYAAVIIGLITLFGAGIGLMNIMLVSVTERTKEIGVRKAVGANSRTIMLQFLVEAIVIGQIGGIMGILLGIGVGNIVASFMNTPFVIPWYWIMVGVTMCLITSVASGIFPAFKAAKLDPIESLRYE